MNQYGLLATLKAKAGKEAEVEKFLKSAAPLAAAEAGTTTWFAFKLSHDTFGIFDTFRDEAGRNAHLSGQIAEALFARAQELFAVPPEVKQIDLLAENLRS